MDKLETPGHPRLPPSRRGGAQRGGVPSPRSHRTSCVTRPSPAPRKRVLEALTEPSGQTHGGLW